MAAGDPLLPTKPSALPDCSDELRAFRSCLRWILIDQSANSCRALLSWSLFFLLAVAVPLISHFVLLHSDHRRPYDAVVRSSMTAAAAVSFLSLSAWTRRYGLSRVLFLDKIDGESKRVRSGYVQGRF